VKKAGFLERLVAMPRLDLGANVVYLPVRHHSPACAAQVGAVIRSVRPKEVLIEGPRDADELLPLLTHEDLKAPVAIFSMCTVRTDAGAERAAAYYPMCDYSPELEAVRAAAEVGASARFIDLTWAQQIKAAPRESDRSKPRSLQDDRYIKRGEWLRAACACEGVCDSDELWDAWFESPTGVEPAEFFRRVLAWCAACREEVPPEELEADGGIARERAMKAEIDDATKRGGPIVVVTGGLHTVALPTTKGKAPAAAKQTDDAGRWLIRYDFQQLDRLNGYASGMPSPAFYQARWQNTAIEAVLVELARAVRNRSGGASTADVVVAAGQLRRLMAFREHARPTRADVLDVVRSCFLKGAEDAEGAAVMAIARTVMTGAAIGKVPTTAARPPIVHDFETIIARLKLSLESMSKSVELDLYRVERHRRISRFMHSLRLMDVPFATCKAGPDFAAGEELHRLREVWTYEWSPMVEAQLVMLSTKGHTVREAATAVLAGQIAEADHAPRRAAAAATLVVEACRCGLHEQAQVLLPKATSLALSEADPISVVAACEQLLLLQEASEPLEAQHLTGLGEAVAAVWRRGAYLIPQLASLDPDSPSAENEGLACLVSWAGMAEKLVDELAAALRGEKLIELADATLQNSTVVGAAAGILYVEGQMSGAELGRRTRGAMSATHADRAIGAKYLRGVLATARGVCGLEPSVLAAVNEALSEMTPDEFVGSLPHLRMAFAEISPRGVEEVAVSVAELLGIRPPVLARREAVSRAELEAGLALDASLRASLERDGLSEFVGTTP
jgi:hypothetical protein